MLYMHYFLKKLRGTHVEGRPGSNNIGINTVKIRVVKPLGDSVPSFYAPDCATTKQSAVSVSAIGGAGIRRFCPWGGHQNSPFRG